MRIEGAIALCAAIGIAGGSVSCVRFIDDQALLGAACADDGDCPGSLRCSASKKVCSRPGSPATPGRLDGSTAPPDAPVDGAVSPQPDLVDDPPDGAAGNPFDGGEVDVARDASPPEQDINVPAIDKSIIPFDVGFSGESSIPVEGGNLPPDTIGVPVDLGATGDAGKCVFWPTWNCTAFGGLDATIGATCLATCGPAFTMQCLTSNNCSCNGKACNAVPPSNVGCDVCKAAVEGGCCRP